MRLMPAGETEANPSPWTIDSLHQHLQEIYREADRRYEQRFKAQEEAVAKAEAQAEQWRASANEWRAAMSDRETRFATNAAVEGLADKIDMLGGQLAQINSRLDTTAGRSSGVVAGWQYIVAGIGAAGGVGGLIAVIVALAQ